MANKADFSRLEPGPVTISRVFSAPRELVFKAWSRAEHVKRWFSPEAFSVPDAEVDFRPGGVFVVCMRSPEGQNFWSRGTFQEISPPERLVLSMGVEVGGVNRFTARTAVTFEVEGAATRMTVRQSYDFDDPDYLASARRAPEGWRTTLDKLEREVARMQAASARSVLHEVFTVRRSYPASTAQVYRALSNKDAKALVRRPGGRRHAGARNGRAAKRPRAVESAMAERPGNDV